MTELTVEYWLLGMIMRIVANNYVITRIHSGQKILKDTRTVDAILMSRNIVIQSQFLSTHHRPKESLGLYGS